MCIQCVLEKKKRAEKKQHTEIMYNIIIRNHFNYDAGEENTHTHAHATRRIEEEEEEEEKTVAQKLLFRLHFFITFLWWTTEK